MPTLYTDGVWTTAKVHGPKRWHTPFPGTSERVAFEQTYRQLAANFTAVTVGTAHPTLTGFYLASESNFQGLDAGAMEWVRTYCKIPASRQEYESFNYTIPGITQDAPAERHEIASVADIGGDKMRITTEAAHGIAEDAILIVIYQFTLTSNPSVKPIVWVYRTALAVAATTIDVDEISDPRGTINEWFAVLDGIFDRDPWQVPVQSFVQLDYYMPGVTTGITTPEDIPLIPAVRITTNVGTETQYYSSTTNPDVGVYLAQVAAGELIVAEDSIFRRWMGNVYERATRYVRAR